MASSSRCNEYIRVQVPCCFTHTPSSLLYPYWGGGGGAGLFLESFVDRFFFHGLEQGMQAGWFYFQREALTWEGGGAYIQTMAFFLQGIVKILN